MHEQTQPAFRIGGIYRDGYGDLCRIQSDTGNGLCQVECLGGRGWEPYAFEHRFRDGRYWRAIGDREISRLDLIPGELNAQGEPIAPTFYVAAPLKASGHPDEMTFEKLMADMLPSAVEPKRAPLPSQSAGRFNNFKGWPIVTSSSQPDYHDKRHTLQQSPDLERQGHQVRPGFALAAVRQLDR